MKSKNCFLLALSLWVSGCLCHLNAQNTMVQVQGLKTPVGQIVLKVYQNQDDYLEGKPFKTLSFPKDKVLNGRISLECKLPKGQLFGIVMFDDANTNNRLDRGIMGIPKEGIGFSNHTMSKMKRPHFDDFKFETMDGAGPITIKVQYM